MHSTIIVKDLSIIKIFTLQDAINMERQAFIVFFRYTYNVWDKLDFFPTILLVLKTFCPLPALKCFRMF